MVDRIAAIWEVLKEVKDPEIPALNVVELGIVRGGRTQRRSAPHSITPTYSGCPAMDTIADDIHAALRQTGQTAELHTVLSPAWTTDWMTDEAHENCVPWGIAPPQGKSADVRSILGQEVQVICPSCKSTKTEMISAFGSTACKALYSCNSCQEPFNYFKCL